MDKIFENSYIVTKKKYMEWAHMAMKKQGKKMMILWAVALALSLSVSVYSLAVDNWAYGILYVAIAAFCLYRGFLRMNRLIEKQYKVLSALQGTEEWTRTIRVDNKITVVDGRQSAQYYFKHAVKMEEIGNYYWIYFKDGISISLDKDGFTEGTREEFLDFMKNHHASVQLENISAA